jgi:hypothetical protein
MCSASALRCGAAVRCNASALATTSPWGRTENLIGQRLCRGSSPALPLLWEAYLAANTELMWHTEPEPS